MNYLTVDLGSTFTKLTAIDATRRHIVATASAFTTIEQDVMTGFDKALTALQKSAGRFAYDRLLCCSSAAGGLKMVAVGLVPELTAKAARMAASNAGAKVVKTYAFELSEQELQEIEAINPDLVLLCGGTDGGNREVIETNATLLNRIARPFSVIVAGNKSAGKAIRELFTAAKRDFVLTDNVMPTFNHLNINPAKEAIRDLFIRNIISAKGLSQLQERASMPIIPTPLAVMNACELLSKGTKQTKGMGELMCVDLGGATTDVYSMAQGRPTMDNIVVKGLPEPYSKRTVEGDLGMRYSLSSLEEAVDFESLSVETGLPTAEIKAWIARCKAMPDTVAQAGSAEADIEDALAKSAIRIAVGRHCGTLESAFTPLGELYSVLGKDLRTIPHLIGIGGALINSAEPRRILEGALYSQSRPNELKPVAPQFYLDAHYIFASMGLLSAYDSETSLELLKHNLKPIQH